MKRVGAIILLLCMVIISIPVWADVDYEAQVLHDLNLIEGDGEGFNLGARLTRAEAVTFVVGILGKTQYVLDHADRYQKSAFPDVPSGAWYTPFVEYCHQNRIVAGTGQGKFEPNAYVSEKSFLTMMLQALGYKSDLDYNWDSVYPKAYEVGLSEDINDAVRTKDEYIYTRADVVHTIYNALDSKLKDKTQILSEFLLERRVCNAYMLKKYDLLKKDEMATQISSVKVLDSNTIEIAFNEPLDDLSKSQLKIEYVNKTIDIDSVNEKNSKTFNISTDDAMYFSKKYKLIIENIMDENGFVTKSLSSEFNGAKKSESIPKDFAIVSAKPISNNQLDVVFSREVDKNAEEPLLYKFGLVGGSVNEGNFQNLKAEVIGDRASHVLLTFTDYRFESNQDYTLYVRADLASVFGERLKNGKGDQINFDGGLEELGDFRVEDMELIDDHFIKIEFSRAFDEKSALNQSNYRIIRRDGKDSRPARRVYLYRDEYGASDDTVMVRFANIFRDEEYELEVEDVKDIYQSQRIRSYNEEFFSGDLDTEEPELIEAEAINRSEIHLTFDKPLAESADQAGIKINNHVIISDKVVSSSNPNVLILYLRKRSYLDEDDEYTVVVKRGIEDYLGRKSSRDQEAYFEGNEEVKPDIDIEKAIMISSNQIKIIFTEPVKKSDLENIDLYKVKYETGAVDRTIFPIDIMSATDNEVVLTLESAYADGNMEVEISQIHSKSGQFISKDLKIDVSK